MPFYVFFTNKLENSFKIELKSKYCIDHVLEPLKSHIAIKINGSLTSEDIIRTVVSLAVDKNSVHSVSKHYSAVACETSLRYHFKKLNLDELILCNEKILLQNPLKTLKTGKSYEFSIDLTNDPYYGKTDSSNEKYVIRSQAKSQQTLFTHISPSTSLTRTFQDRVPENTTSVFLLKMGKNFLQNRSIQNLLQWV